MLYRLSPPLYSVDPQKSPPKNSKLLHTMFLWISFRITIGFVNLQIVTIYFLWISFRIRIGFVNFSIDLALLYRLLPLLYSVDSQKSPPKNSKSLHTMFLWISFRITIGFVNLQIVTNYFLWISFRIIIGFVNLFPLNNFYSSGFSALAWFSLKNVTHWSWGWTRRNWLDTPI